MIQEPHWQAPKGVDTPDFVIIGAMKSGTTSLHAMLNLHPDIYIPDNELLFFDLDNIHQHPDFTKFSKKQWRAHRLEDNVDGYWQWYSDKFSDATTNQIRGEDSTTYLYSEDALRRLSLQHKSAKLIVMLRHPTARTYSHYWHMVKAGRALYRFEDMLMYCPHLLIERSAYRKHLATVYRYFDKSQVQVLLFEDFIDDPKRELENVCQFLGVDFAKLPNDASKVHVNKAKLPKFVGLELLKSRLFRASMHNAYDEHFGNSLASSVQGRSLISKLLYKTYRKVNPLIIKKAPPINISTKQHLDRYFQRELSGLEQLIGQDALKKWFT